MAPFSSFFLLLFLLSLFPEPLLSNSGVRKLKEAFPRRRPELSAGLHQWRSRGGHCYGRVQLHEVHSGPNPISNALPLQHTVSGLGETP
ncbi:hypothetical protein AMTRI_Chr12g271540 [Amborella trichopoda]